MSIGQEIEQTFYATMIVFSLIGLVWYLAGYGDHEHTRWQRLCSWFVNRYFTSRRDREEADEEVVAEDDHTATTTDETQQQRIAITDDERNTLLFKGKIDALATMVAAGKVGETEGIRLVFKVAPSSTSERYQEARVALKAKLEQLRNKYPPLTKEQQETLAQLGLAK